MREIKWSQLIQLYPYQMSGYYLWVSYSVLSSFNKEVDIFIKVMKTCPYETLIGMDELNQFDEVTMTLTTGNSVEIYPIKDLVVDEVKGTKAVQLPALSGMVFLHRFNR